LERPKPDDESECHEHSYTHETLHLSSYSEARIDYLLRGGTKVQLAAHTGQMGNGTSPHK